jgi:hypothetical protein
MEKLARFRADPALVRVAVHRGRSGWWWACITSRDGTDERTFAATNTHPSKAIMTALERADTGGMAGIDLNMDRVYDHPMWKP